MKNNFLKKNFSFQGISLMALAIIMLWIKTYITYKISFDLTIENAMQEFILFINPLSFLMLVFGIGLFLKEKRRPAFILITSFLVTAILYGNVVYYREFTDFLTVALFKQTSNMGDLASSIFTLMTPWDLLFFVDVLILGLIIKFKPKFVINKTYTKTNRRVYYLLVVAIGFFNLGLAETERPQLLTRSFDREYLVKYIGTYNYHLYDAYLQTKTSAQRALADGSELADIENYVRANYKEPNQEMKGIAKDKNLIVISLESLQNFVINNTLNGEEITPFLNSLIKDSFYFDNFYHQVGQGKTSDSEFLLENSLYPLSRGAVFFTNAENELTTLAETLRDNGYSTAALHANGKSFWNRDVMYESIGYDRFYNIDDYEVNDENSVGWGLKDKDFFAQSREHLKELQSKGTPFYAKFITLTNHHPYTLNEEDATIGKFDSNSKTLNNYFQTVRYMDEAIEQFFTQLKEDGLYDNSVIVMYGDHYGISENHNTAMAQYLNKESITPFDSVQLQRVPLIIHVPGQKGKTISTVSGQIDLKPTILNLLGYDANEDIQFGSDIMSKENLEFTVLRDGSFITDKYVYTNETLYDKATGEVIEDKSIVKPYIEKAEQELDFSDKIIYGDLLRFIDSDETKKSKE
ncbi:MULTISPECIES: LTA synthase family protein [Bacillus]|uniref:LTA synthase family protein n=1 Tax=Bacillus TaxID=1386 RepID=UPI0002ED685C|nr:MULTISPECIES: LTA synthase family protein [Bacillus]